MQNCYIKTRVMASVVVCAAPQNMVRARRFARNELREAELRTFEDLFRNIPLTNVLVYLTHPDYDHVRGLLQVLKPNAPYVVIYYARHAAPEEAAGLGRLVGELRPRHTAVVFEAKAAVASVLYAPRHGSQKDLKAKSENRVRSLREKFALTQTDMAQALGVSLRTIQNWERNNQALKGYRIRDLEELRSVLHDVVADPDLPVWLRSENEAFQGKRPIDLVIEGKSRDILAEFRRLQAGDPI
jgi:DNA-binding transcriptional regulator YiaG